MAKQTLPLCSETCPYHTDQTATVASLKTMAKIFAGVFGTVVIIGGGMIMDTRADMKDERLASIERCERNAIKIEAQARADKRDAVKRDQEIAQQFLAVATETSNDINEIVRVMAIFSLNQKRVMENANLPYMAPEEVHRGSNNTWRSE